MEGKLFCLIGISGVGKTEVRKFCVERIPILQYLPSYTTRLQRQNEEHGKDYFFVSENDFEQLIKEEKLLEWEKHFDHYYGISKELFLNKINSGVSLIKEIAIDGYKKIVDSYRPETIYSIYLQPDNILNVVDRINQRGDKEIEKRISSFEEELKAQNFCNNIIISEHGKLALLCEKVQNIIEEELQIKLNPNSPIEANEKSNGTINL